MTTQVIPVNAGDFDGIHRGLLQRLNPRIERESWRRIFEWGWANPENHVGHALLAASGAYVGFAGTIYSDLQVGGARHRICNLTSWVVRDEFRSSALAVVMPVLRRPEVTVTNLTSLPEVNDMFRKLGFRTLETHTRIFLPWAGRGAGASQTSGFSPLRVHRVAPPEMLDPLVTESEGGGLPLPLPGEPCQHWVLEAGDALCHIAFTVGRRRRLRTIRLHHASRPEFLWRHAADLSMAFLRHLGAPLFECDDRFLQGREVPGTRRVALPVSRIFRSSTLDPADLSNLRSELPLLNL